MNALPLADAGDKQRLRDEMNRLRKNQPLAEKTRKDGEALREQLRRFVSEHPGQVMSYLPFPGEAIRLQTCQFAFFPALKMNKSSPTSSIKTRGWCALLLECGSRIQLRRGVWTHPRWRSSWFRAWHLIGKVIGSEWAKVFTIGF